MVSNPSGSIAPSVRSDCVIRCAHWMSIRPAFPMSQDRVNMATNRSGQVMWTSISKWLIVITVMSSSCGSPKGGGEYVEPLILEEMPLPLLDYGEGIYPSDAVLKDTQNPFIRTAMSPANRW